MFSVIGDALEAITKLDCGSLLKKLLWEPLKMSSTFWRLEEVPKDEQEKDLARGYYWVPDNNRPGGQGGCFVPEPYLEFAGIAPAGATISTVMDYSKWIKELLHAAQESGNASPIGQGHVLSSDMFRELTAPRSMVAAPPMSDRNDHLSHRSYALGWVVLPPIAGVDHPIITHAGGLTGFGAQLYIMPNDDFGVVTLANTAMTSNIVGDLICLDLIGRKLGLNDDERAKFVQSLNPKLPPDALLEEGTASEELTTSSDQKTLGEEAKAQRGRPAEDLLDSLVGEYEHAAFGRFRLSLYNSVSQQKPVVYLPWTSYADRASRDEQRGHPQVHTGSAVRSKDMGVQAAAPSTNRFNCQSEWRRQWFERGYQYHVLRPRELGWTWQYGG